LRGDVVTLTEFVDEIANELDGTCDSVDWMMTKHEVAFEVDAVEDALVQRHNLERCSGCDWWMESCELDGGGDDDWVGYCDDCRPRAEED